MAATYRGEAMTRRTLVAALFLAAFTLLALVAPTRADDHGDTPATATAVAIGSVTRGIIEVPGDIDYFRFTVATTAPYVIFTRGTSSMTGVLTDATINQIGSASSGSGEQDG